MSLLDKARIIAVHRQNSIKVNNTIDMDLDEVASHILAKVTHEY